MLGCVGAGDLDTAWIGTRVVDELRAPALHEIADDADAGLDRGVLQHIGDVADGDDRAIGPAIGLRQEDRAVVAMEQLFGVGGDTVHHRCEVEGRRQVATHLGERSRLARTSLRLVEQACVLERDGETAGKRFQQTDIRIAEGEFALHVHQLDQTVHLVAGRQRNVNGRRLGLRARYDI